MRGDALEPATIRVAACDDHPLVIEGLCSLLMLDRSITLVGTALDSAAAEALVSSARPDVLLLDIRIGHENGFELAERILAKHPSVRIAALTAYEDPTYVERAQRMGLSGYLLKRSGLRQLVDAIKSIARGSRYFDPLVVADVLADARPQDELTHREREIATRLALGYTNKEVARDLAISVKTVETHRGHVFAKLSLHSRTELIRYAYRHGWFDGL